MSKHHSKGQHSSVLLEESIKGLHIVPDGVYVDGTFGRGGHSRAILKSLNEKGRLLAIDKDPSAIEYAKNHFGDDPRFSIHHGSFAQILDIVKHQELNGKVNGVLLDLGVSSPQLDEAERGFSFIQDGPLDMRMDTTAPQDAKQFVNEASVDEMTRVFKEYGEERYAKRIANAIERRRREKAFTTTLDLAEVVKVAHPKWEKHKHPATRVFQAIRIHINQELAEIEQFLVDSYEVLATGGRLAIISFHSLEDRIIKQFLRRESKGKSLPLEIPVQYEALDIRFKTIGKAIKPSNEEIEHNKRARSAVLRIGEKVV